MIDHVGSMMHLAQAAFQRTSVMVLPAKEWIDLFETLLPCIDAA
jgi:hypothetical protein